MPDEGENFEAELDAILNGGEAAPEAKPTAAPTGQPTEAAKDSLRFGNRDWASPTDLGKAYESLLKDYSRKSNEYKANEKWVNWGKQVDKHPELRKTLEQRIDEWHKGAGSQPQPQAVPQELQERMDRFEGYMAKREVESEIGALKSKYSPDKATLSATLAKAADLAEKGVDIPLEDVYRIVSFDAQALKSKADGEREGAARSGVKKAANVGGSSASAVAPGAKQVGSMNKEEYDRALSDELAKYGITG